MEDDRWLAFCRGFSPWPQTCISRRVTALRALLVLVLCLAVAGCGVETPAQEGEAPAPEDGITASAGAGCPGADDLPEQRGEESFARAVRCLLNAERQERGLDPLSPEDRLAEAAQVHTDDMAERSYFAHRSPEGADPGDRARAAGYAPRIGRSWRVGENLGYGSGPLGTPRELMLGWMQSPGHRSAILQPAFEEVGVGVSFGSPGNGRPQGVLAATVFGAR
jgi:uncharacterized protein YkwD